MTGNVFQHHDGSSTTKPVAMVSAINERLLRLNHTGTSPQTYQSVKPAPQRRNNGGATRTQEQKHHQNHQCTEITSVCSTSSSDARIVGERPGQFADQLLPGWWIVIPADGADAVYRLDNVGFRQLADHQKMAGLALVIPALRTSCTESVPSPHRPDEPLRRCCNE